MEALPSAGGYEPAEALLLSTGVSMVLLLQVWTELERCSVHLLMIL